MALPLKQAFKELPARVLSAGGFLLLFGGVLYLGPPYMFYFLGLILLGLWGEVARLFLRTKPRTWTGFAILLLAFFVATCACVVVFPLFSQRSGVWILGWVCVVVWMADSCAYGVGKIFQGPRLAPRISPGKTWSGSLGGLVGGSLGSLVYLCLWGKSFSLNAVCFTGILILCAQGGDLLESGAKRFWGVKDSGSLLPGHGGLWDRLDGLLFAFIGLGLSLLVPIYSVSREVRWCHVLWLESLL